MGVHSSMVYSEILEIFYFIFFLGTHICIQDINQNLMYQLRAVVFFRE